MKYVEGWRAKTAIAGIGGARAAAGTALAAGAVASYGHSGVGIVSGTYSLFLFFPIAMTVLTLTGAAAGALAALYVVPKAIPVVKRVIKRLRKVKKDLPKPGRKVKIRKTRTVDDAIDLIKDKYHQFQLELDRVRRQGSKLPRSGKVLLKKLERVEREVGQDLEELRFI